jgi:hypothetical protein
MELFTIQKSLSNEMSSLKIKLNVFQRFAEFMLK